MVFKVLVTDEAALDLQKHADLIAKDSVLYSQKWFEEAWNKIFSLRENPLRNAVTDIGVKMEIELREMLHYSHRIFYWVDESTSTVEVLRIWHQARQDIQRSDLN